jgi:hypothetical protein
MLSVIMLSVVKTSVVAPRARLMPSSKEMKMKEREQSSETSMDEIWPLGYFFESPGFFKVALI